MRLIIQCLPHPSLRSHSQATPAHCSPTVTQTFPLTQQIRARRRVIWVQDAAADGARSAAAVPFREVSMHAISRDADFYQKPCIYCQLDKPEALQRAGGDEGEDDAAACSLELLFVPDDESQGAAFCMPIAGVV
jgi:Regulator of volume decrease after cellular swelling